MSSGAKDRIQPSWDDVVALSIRLARLAEAAPFDVILAISRGGLIPAALIAQHLDRREVEMAAAVSYSGEARQPRIEIRSFPPDETLSGKRVLVVDDVWDSGRTAIAIRDRVARAGGVPIVAVLHYKPLASHAPGDAPDLFVERTEAWIVYPWERVSG